MRPALIIYAVSIDVCMQLPPRGDKTTVLEGKNVTEGGVKVHLLRCSLNNTVQASKTLHHWPL